MSALSGCILVTGGTGALGTLIAQWLCGSFPETSIVLLGRSGRMDENGDPVKQTLMKGGSRVLIMRGDVASAAEVTAAMQLCQQISGGLHAAIHAGS